MDNITITLPEPPSANRYWRNARGRFVRSTAANNYKSTVGWQAIAQGVGNPLDGEVAVTLRWFRGRRSGDLDNRIKVAVDALNGIAYEDDKQIVELHAFRFDDKQNPRLEVQVCAAGE